MRTELKKFQIEYADLSPIDVTVPCSLLGAMHAIGRIPDPTTALGERAVASVLSEGVCFSTVLCADELMLSRSYVYLRFHGLYAGAVIALDGRTLATATDAHAPLTVEVHNYLTLGEHRLTVTYPPAAPAVAGRAYLPDLGIFRAVECIAVDGAAIDTVGAYAERRGEDTVLCIRADLLGDGRGTRAVAAVCSPAGEYFYAGLTDFAGEVDLRIPAHFYPQAIGPAACYRLTVTLYRDAEAIDAAELSVGVRAVSVKEGEGGEMPQLVLRDGSTYLPCGSTYYPTAPLLAKESAALIDARVADAAAAGMDTLYAVDVGVYPPDAFYTACDARGITVAQELCSPACRTGDPDTDLESARLLIARAAHHPSLTFFYIREASSAYAEPLDALVKEYDPTLSCLSLPSLDLPAFPALPSLSTLKKYLPLDGMNLLSAPMIGTEVQKGDLIKLLQNGFALYPYANGMERTVYLSSILQADKMKDLFRKRRLKNGGEPLIFGRLSDAAVSVSDAVTDASGCKKAAWYAFRRACAKVALYVREEEGRRVLFLSNIGTLPFTGEMTCRVCDRFGNAEKELTAQVSAPPASLVRAGELFLEPAMAARADELYLSLSLFDGQSTVYSDTVLFVTPREFRFAYPEIHYEIKGSGREFLLFVTSASYAKYVKFDFQTTDVSLANNYFDLTKGVTLRIPLTTRSNTTAETLMRDLTYMSVYDLMSEEPLRRRDP